MKDAKLTDSQAVALLDSAYNLDTIERVVRRIAPKAFSQPRICSECSKKHWTFKKVLEPWVSPSTP